MMGICRVHMDIGRLARTLCLGTMIGTGIIAPGCASAQRNTEHDRRAGDVREFVAFYSAEVEPLNCQNDADLVITRLQPRLDHIRQHSFMSYGLSGEEQETLAQAYTDLGMAFYCRAVLSGAQENYESAIRYSRDALAIKGNDAGLLTNLGLIYYAMERYDSAAASFQQALNVEPYNSSARGMRDIALERSRENRR